ncbi:MAG: hypothetical protein IPH57_17965 [Saprospiraceae bacterium]|nr:hypothetical protein [Saprospiraceae bacterium]
MKHLINSLSRWSRKGIGNIAAKGAARLEHLSEHKKSPAFKSKIILFITKFKNLCGKRFGWYIFAVSILRHNLRKVFI